MKAPLVVLAALLSATPAFANLLPAWFIEMTDVNDVDATVSWPDAPAGCPPDPWVVQLKVPPAAGGVPDKWVTLGNYAHALNNVTMRDLYPETDYEVKVSFDGVESGTRSFTTKRSFTGPFTATLMNQRDLHLSWPAQADATGYYLEVREGGILTAVHLSSALTSYEKFGVQDQSLISVRIYAALPGDDRTGWAEDEVTTGLNTPAPFTAIQTQGGPTMRLQWQQVWFVMNGYRIERSTWDNQGYGFLYQEAGHGNTTYDDVSADPATKYCYRIRAENSPTEFSAWVESCGWTTLPPAPANLTTTEVTDSRIAFEWDAIPGITEYVIERTAMPFTFWEQVGTSPSSGFTDGFATDFPVFPGNTYHYRIRGRTHDPFVGDTASSPSLIVTTPSANPGPLTAVVTGGGSSVDLTWTNVFGESGYRLEQRSATTTGDFGAWSFHSNRPVNASAVSIGVSAGKRYQYRLRSYNGAGDSSWAESASVSTAAGVPVNVVATPGSGPGNNDCNDTITVNWDQVPGADGYIVRRTVPADLGGGTEFMIAGGATTTFADVGLAANTVYVYRLRSTNRGVESAEGTVLFGQTCPWLSATGSGTNVNLVWTGLESPFSEYRLERRDVDAGGTWQEIATVSPITTANFTDTTTAADSTYEYRMRGWKAGAPNFGRYSISDATTTGPPPVTGFHVTNCGVSSISFGWDPAYSATQIKVLRAPAATGSFNIIATLPGTTSTYIDTTVSPETEYIYWIFATTPNGENSSNQLAGVWSKFPCTITVEGPDSATIDWDSPSTQGVNMFRLEKDTGSGWVLNGSFFSFVTASFKAALNCGDKFRVVAIDAGANVLAISETVAFEPPTDLPAPSGSPIMQVLSSSAVQVSWNQVPGNAGYRIERWKWVVGPWVPAATVSTDTTSFIDYDVESGAEYYYRVAALEPCGGGLGDWSTSSVRTQVWTLRQEWRVGHWGNTPEVVNGTGVYADLADFDGDACPNVFEFVHDTDPANRADYPTPTIAVELDAGGPRFEVRWPMRDDLDGIVPTFEVSRDLEVFEDYSDVTGAFEFGGTPFGYRGVLIPPGADINGSTTGGIYARLRLNNL